MQSQERKVKIRTFHYDKVNSQPIMEKLEKFSFRDEEKYLEYEYVEVDERKNDLEILLNQHGRGHVDEKNNDKKERDWVVKSNLRGIFYILMSKKDNTYIFRYVTLMSQSGFYFFF